MFAIYPIFLAVSSFEHLARPEIGWFACLLYLAAVFPTVAGYRGWRMPTFQAVLNFAVAAFIPFLLLPHIPPTEVGSYDTWFVGALATLLGATAVRGFTVYAVAGLVLIIGHVLAWGGTNAIANTGLFGAVIFVVSGWLMSLGFQTVSREALEHRDQAAKNAASVAAQVAANIEFEKRMTSTLRTALPLLVEIRDREGFFDDDLKNRALQLEASLRDEIRGDRLISEQMRTAVASARMRGVEVTLLDEGGLAEVSEAERLRILGAVSNAISGINSGRITVRAPSDAEFRVSVLATRAGEPKPDLWLKIS
jgi:hypothetical protein